MGSRVRELLILGVLVISLVWPAAANAAYTPNAGSTAGVRMRALGILQGRGPGDLALDEEITRAELVTVIVRAFGKEADAQLLKGSSIFPDTANHWASGNIAMAVALVDKAGADPIGMPDGTFDPEGKLTPAQAVAFLMKFVGVRRDPTKSWPYDFLDKAVQAGLLTAEDRSVIAPMAEENATRGLVFYLFDRAFYTYKLPTGRTFYTQYVDTTEPDLRLSGDALTTTESAVTISGHVSADATDVYVGTTRVTPDASGYFTVDYSLTDDAADPYWITVTAIDLAGNRAEQRVRVTRATGTAEAIEADDITVEAGSTVAVNVRVKDARGRVLTDVPVIGASELGTFVDGMFTAGQTPGTGTLTLRTGDLEKTVYATVISSGDLTITYESSAQGTNGSVIVTWETNNPADSWVTVNGQRFGQDERTTSHSVEVTGLERGQSYTAVIESSDGSQLSNTSLDFSTEAGGLEITWGPGVAGSGSTSVTVSWATKAPASSWVTVNGRRFGSDQLVTSHNVTVTDLEPGQDYTADVTSESATYGAASSSVSISTVAAPIVISGAATSNVTENGATVTWETSRPASSHVTVDGMRFGRDEPTTNHAVEVSGLQPGQTYQAQIESGDGSQEPATASITITTPARRLVITWGPELAGWGSTSATVSWATNEPSSSWVTVNGRRFGSDQLVTSHNVPVTDLEPGTTYVADIQSDSATFGTASGSVSITTMGDPGGGGQDTVPPHVWMPDMQAEYSSAVPLSWSGSDAESGIDHYDVTWWDTVSNQRGYVVQNTTETSATFTETVSSHFYVFEVTAYDRAGNHASAARSIHIR